MKILKIALFFIAILASTFPAIAHEYKLGELVINHPVARETPPGVKVGAGYLTITNNGKNDDKLIFVTGIISPTIEIHTMSVENNIMKMQEIKGGLTIPAGQSVTLQAGGLHLMFMNLPQQLKDGEKYDVTLVFEKAGEIDVTFNVKKHKKEEHGEHSKHKGHDTKTKKHKH